MFWTWDFVIITRTGWQKALFRLFVIMDSLGSHPRWLPTVYRIKSKGLSMAFKASWLWSNYSRAYHLPAQTPGTVCSGHSHSFMPFLSFLFFKMPHPPAPAPDQIFFLNLMKPSSFWKGSESVSHLAMSDCLWPHGLQPVRLLCPWNSPGKNTGGTFLLQGIFLTKGSNPDRPHCAQILYCLSHQGSLIPNG